MMDVDAGQSADEDANEDVNDINAVNAALEAVLAAPPLDLPVAAVAAVAAVLMPQDPLTVRIAQALRHEQVRQAHELAAADIALRIETGEVAGFLELFLETHWQAVLVQAHAGGVPQVLAQALRTMDDLIWSVQPKTSAAQCKELLARLSTILGAVNVGLDQIAWHSPERNAFFTQLAQRHALLVRVPVSTRRRVEWAVNIAEKISERRWHKENRAQQAVEEDASMQLVNQLHAASWIEFRRDNHVLENYKVAWISPRRSIFILIDGDGLDFFSVTAEDLAQNFRNQSARIILAI
jgi:hypothetical protein